MKSKKVWNRLFLGALVSGVACFGVIVASEGKSELASVTAKVEHVLSPSEEAFVLSPQDGKTSASAKEVQIADFIEVTEPLQATYVEATPMPQQATFVETTPVPTKEPERVTAVETVEVTQKKESAYDDSEINQLFRIVHAESAGEPFKGQMAVAAVILNRLETKGFPNDLCEVIMEKNQFSPVQNKEIYFGGKVLKSQDVSDSVIEATQRALAGEDPTEKLLWAEAERLGLDPEKYAAGGALFFYAPKGCSQQSLEERENIRVKVRIGDHIFYKVWG